MHAEAKKHAVRFLAFVLILFAVLKGISIGIDGVCLKKKGIVTGRLQNVVGCMNEPANSLDIVVLGDSESYNSFSPMIFWKNNGVTSYVMGQSGQQITEAYNNLSEVLTKQNPRLVLLETNMLFRSPAAVSDKANVLYHAVNQNFSVLRFHNLWKRVGKASSSVMDNFFKGYTIVENVNAYEGSADYMAVNKKDSQISDHVRKYTQMIADLCKEKNIQLVFYTAPSPVNSCMGMSRAVTAYAKELGVPYYDLNLKTAELGINWQTDTYDKGDHLNASGAVKVSQYLSRQLAAFHLPNHQNETAYQSWARLEKDYEIRMMAVLERNTKWQISL